MRRPVVGLLLVCSVWAVIGHLVVPSLILAAYDGESLPLLNRLIESQSSNPPSFYLDQWRALHLISLLLLLAIPLSFPPLVRRAPAFAERFVGRASPQALGAIRFWVFLILLINVVWEDLPSIAHLPSGLRVDMGIMTLLHQLPGWQSLYASYGSLTALKYITSVFLFLAMVGLGTRFVVPIAAALAMVHGGILREYSHLFHTCLVPIHMAFVLSFTPCGDGFSADRYLNKRRPNASGAAYAWSRYACWVVVAGAYLAAGLSKIRNGGLLWWQGDNLKHIVLTDVLNPMHFEWGLEQVLHSAPTSLFAVMGLSALIVEISFPALLFSRRARLVLPPLAVGLHLGILLLQGVLFYDLILIQAIFFSWLPHRAERPIPSECRQRGATRGGGWGQHRLAMSRCLTLVGLFTVSWALQVEKYPVTAWQMYSDYRQGSVVQYKRVLATYADGRIEPFHPERWIGAVADTRYRDILRKNGGLQRAFLEAALLKANEAGGLHPIRSVEVQTWRWDINSDPNGSMFGEQTGSLSYP